MIELLRTACSLSIPSIDLAPDRAYPWPVIVIILVIAGWTPVQILVVLVAVVAAMQLPETRQSAR